MEDLQDLFPGNGKWQEIMSRLFNNTFKQRIEKHQPKYMWIGCSDSRVPPNEACGLMPGEIFIHRNIANLIKDEDPNCMSAVQYAVDVLEVKKIIVCGHYCCGGIETVIQNQEFGYLAQWLQPLQKLYQNNKNIIDNILSKVSTEDTKFEIKSKVMCELNVLSQSVALAHYPIIQESWKKSNKLKIYSVIYDIYTGQLKKVSSRIEQGRDIEEIYKKALSEIFKRAELEENKLCKEK